MQNLTSAIQLIYQGCKNPHCHRFLIETAYCPSWTFSMTCSYVISLHKSQNTHSCECCYLDNSLKSTLHRLTLI